MSWENTAGSEQHAGFYLRGALDIFHICLFGLVHGGGLRRPGHRKIREPRIFERSRLSGIRGRRFCGDPVPDALEGKSPSTLFRLPGPDHGGGISHGIFAGKAVSQQMVGLFQRAFQSLWICLPEILRSVGIGLHLCDEARPPFPVQAHNGVPTNTRPDTSDPFAGIYVPSK